MLKMNFFPVCLFRIGKVINWRAKSKGLRLDSTQTIFSFASRWWKKQYLSLLKTEFKTYTGGSWGITTIVNDKRILRWNIQNQHTSLKWGAKIGCMKPDNAPPITEEKPEYKKKKRFLSIPLPAVAAWKLSFWEGVVKCDLETEGATSFCEELSLDNAG